MAASSLTIQVRDVLSSEEEHLGPLPFHHGHDGEAAEAHQVTPGRELWINREDAIIGLIRFPEVETGVCLANII
jgi:hypothetical protein